MDRQIVWPREGIKPCPKCREGTMVVRVNRGSGALFIGCNRYPACKWTGKTAYGLDCCGHSYPRPLDPAKCAKSLYGVELSQLRTGAFPAKPLHAPIPSAPTYADDDPWREDEDMSDGQPPQA